MSELKEAYSYIIENKKVCDQKQIELEKREADIEYTEKALKAKVKDIPLLVELFADIEWERSGLIEQALVMKRNPSIKGSIEVAKVKREKQKIIRELKSLKYKMFYYEQMVPWLLELEDDDIVPQELEVFNRENTNDEDASSYWLTTNEYMTLPTV